jgi:hypothetical protein
MSELAQPIAVLLAVAAAAGYLTYRVLLRRRGQCGDCGRCERASASDGAPAVGSCKEARGLRSPGLRVIQR